MKKAIRVFVVVVALCAAAGGAYWYLQNRAASEASAEDTGSYTQIMTAQRGNLTAVLSVVGQLEAVQSADLAFEQMAGTAQVISMTVETGSTVVAGQPLAAIDPVPYLQALDQAKSDLQAAEETLEDLLAPVTELKIAQADLSVAKAQLQLQQSQDTLDDLLHPDITELESAVAEAQNSVAQAEADVLALQQDSTTEDQLSRLREAEADAWAVYSEWAGKTHSDTDEAYVDKLALYYNKMMDAQDARVTAEVQVKVSALRADMAARKAKLALDEAQESLAEARAGGDKLAQAQAQVAVQEAQVALELAQDERAELDEGADATAVATAQANVDKKRLAVADAEEALAGTTIVAPFDGTVLQSNVEVGDTVAANTTALSLANLKSLQVVASVDETTIRQVSAGQEAVISFDAFPGQTFRGEVLSVPLQGTLQGGVTVYDVELSLAGAEGVDLLVGMTANVEIQSGSVTDALLVPALAVEKVNGQYQVAVPNTTDPAGEPETVPVEIGLSNGTYTQIVKGLNEGDQVIVQLSAGTDDEQMFMMQGGPVGGMMIQVEGGPPSGGAFPAGGGQVSPGGNP